MVGALPTAGSRMSPAARPPITHHSLDIDLGPARTRVLAFDGDPSAPALLIVPALGVPARHYVPLGNALAERGCNAMAIDLRGVGDSPVRARRGVDWGYLDLVDVELPALFRLAGERWPDAPRQWLGHSLGGHLALLHQARHPSQRARRVHLVASGSPWYRNYHPWWHRLGVHAFGLIARGTTALFGVFPGDWLRFGGPQGATMMREWSGFCRHGTPGRLGADGWNADAALAAVDVPVNGIGMAGDSYAPRRSTEHLASLTRGPFAMGWLERLDDGREPGHFLWLRQPRAVVERLAVE